MQLVDEFQNDSCGTYERNLWKTSFQPELLHVAGSPRSLGTRRQIPAVDFQLSTSKINIKKKKSSANQPSKLTRHRPATKL